MQAGDPWCPTEVFDEVDSTNAVCVADPRAWRVVTAERQTQGRGRLDRAWTTVPHSALAVSVVVPHDALDRSRMPLGWLPLVAGLAVVGAVADVCGLRTALKWPNDVLVPADGDRKLAGILCEWTPEGVVVGTGVNVDTPREALPLETATSLRAAGHPGVPREVLLTAYLTHLADLVTGDTDRGRRDYARASATLGRDILVHLPGGGSVHGRATGMDEHGRLVLETADGCQAVTAGDVIHVREVQ